MKWKHVGWALAVCVVAACVVAALLRYDALAGLLGALGALFGWVLPSPVQPRQRHAAAQEARVQIAQAEAAFQAQIAAIERAVTEEVNAAKEMTDDELGKAWAERVRVQRDR